MPSWLENCLVPHTKWIATLSFGGFYFLFSLSHLPLSQKNSTEMTVRNRCAVSPGWCKDWVVAGPLSQKLKLRALGWESHCLRTTSTAHTMDPAARAHIPQPCQAPLCAARLCTAALAAPSGTRTRMCWQSIPANALAIPHLCSRKQGSCYVFTGTLRKGFHWVTAAQKEKPCTTLMLFYWPRSPEEESQIN